MRVLLLLFLPFLLQGRSIVRERNDVIKQALIPTLVNIIGHARMEEHGIGDNMDGLLDFMDEEKILDPFLQWLGWFTDIVVEKEEPADSGESEESRSIVRERNDVIKQALIPTLVNIIRHARMQEHGVDIDEILDYMDEENILDPFLQWLGWFTDMVLEKEDGEKDDKSNESDESLPIESNEYIESDESTELKEYDETALELEVLEKEESMEESIKKMVEEEENYHGEIPEDEKVEEEVLEKEESLEESVEDEIYDDEAPETEHEKPAMWPGDPKGYNGPMIPNQDDVPEDLIEEGVPLRWA